ncbi:MAG: DUF1499 domain-containing protein [Sphingomonadaceae bacterium]
MAGEKRRGWAKWLTRIGLMLAIGAPLAALIAGHGSGEGWWDFRPALRALAFLLAAALLGALLSLIAFALNMAAKRRGAAAANFAALFIAGIFIGFLGSNIMDARRAPPIHEVTTNLDDYPEFTALEVREDRLQNVPAFGPAKGEPDDASRWRAMHRAYYGDIRPLALDLPKARAIDLAQRVARERGWEIASVNEARGTIEATDTTRFFGFKDDVVIRVKEMRGNPGASVVDMRSISRVGISDLGKNAERVRAYLADLEAAAARG